MEQRYTLQMIHQGRPLRVPVHQYDAGSRVLLFDLIADGTPFTVPSGAAITIDGTKPDGHSFSYGASGSGSTVSATVTQQMAACAGEAVCQLTITQSGTVLGSANFVLDVEQNALPEDADMSETEIASLRDMMQRAAASAEKSQEYAEKTKALLSSVPVVVIGSEEPEGPALWFQTTKTMPLVTLSAATAGTEVQAEVDGTTYGVENMALGDVPENGFGVEIL